MRTDAGDKPSASLVSRLVSCQRPHWAMVGISLLLILAPIGVAQLDGVLYAFFKEGYWRLSLLPPAVIIYILFVSPRLDRGEARVIEGFRPVVLIDDDSFVQLVNEASRLNPVAEVIAFAAGAAFGLVFGRTWLSDANVFWLRWYLSLSASLMFGLLGWSVYATVASTRLTAELHRQPLRIDIFDTKPFEPIGRQSLMIALVFVGGIALSIVFRLEQGNIYAWHNWLIYIPLAFAPVLVFFLNMRDTHRVLAAEKKRELEAVQRKIRLASRTLMKRIDASESTGTLTAEINALAVYEEHLQAARTWPYDTSMLRTLFVSIAIPGGATLARIVSAIFFD